MARKQTRVRSFLMAIALLGLLATQAAAQGAGPAPAAADLAQLEQGTPTAPVMSDGAAVLRVRDVSSFPADQRARTIAGRIREIAANPAIRPDALRITESEFSSQIAADGHLVMNVYDLDSRSEGVPRQVLADPYLGHRRVPRGPECASPSAVWCGGPCRDARLCAAGGRTHLAPAEA